MPSNRPEVDTDTKRREIRHAARTVFFRQGYDRAGVARIAREAGVTANTLYWYYGGKDELFAAVVEELVELFLASLASREPDEPLESILGWVVDSLEASRALIVTVHEKSLSSPAVARVHDHFHDRTEALMADILARRGMAEENIVSYITIISFVVEGLVMHELARKRRDAVIRSLANF